MLVNLALNARDAMPARRHADDPTTATTLAARRPSAGAPGPTSSSVTDNGEGMDAETAARAFEPFFTTKPQGEGSGLGLASVYGIVGQSGGFVRVASQPGFGDELRDPPTRRRTSPVPQRRLARPVDGGTTSAAPLACCPRRRRPLVLVAEDEEIVREYLTQILTSDEFDVHAAANGDEALQLLDRLARPVDVLVTDMVMPGLSGRKLAERLKFLEPDASVVFISGYSEDAALEERPLAPPRPSSASRFRRRRFLTAVREAVRAKARAARRERPCPRAIASAAWSPTTIPPFSTRSPRYLDAAGFSVVAAARALTRRCARSSRAQPAVALIDIALEPFDGIELARQAKIASPDTSVVLYTGSRDPEHLRHAFAIGVRGFVVKDAPLSELVDALTTVAERRHPHRLRARGPSLATIATSPPVRPHGTPAPDSDADLERPDQREDRRKLNISPETVQTHVKNAMHSLGADTRTQAVAAALRHALIA